MLKWGLRLLVLLVLVTALAAGIYWLVQTSPRLLGVDGEFTARSERGQAALQRFASDDTGEMHLGQARGAHHSEGGSLLSLARSLGLIALVTLAVIGLQQVFAWLRRLWRSRPAQAG